MAPEKKSPAKAKAPEPEEEEEMAEDDEEESSPASKDSPPQEQAEPDEEEGEAEDTETGEAPEEPKKAQSGQPTPKKSDARKKAEKKPEAAPKTPAKAKEKVPPAPRRPTLSPEVHRLLGVRRAQDRRRPRFTRQQMYRYWSLGRWESWRRPRGMQSKQRRHYGYRSQVVSIGFGSPAATRGMTPTGFTPVVVRTPKEIETLDTKVEAAIIARTVGTRRRLVLEEIARKKGLHVLNPIVEEREE